MNAPPADPPPGPYQPPQQVPYQQPYPAAPYPVAPPKKDMNLAIIAIALAAAAWVTQAHLLASVPAIVIGFIALVKMRKEPERYDTQSGPWLAIIGIIIGALNVIVIVGVVLFYILVVVLQISLGAF